MTGVALAAVDSVSITMLMDNVTDMLVMDTGPAKRVGLASGGPAPTIAAPMLEGGRTFDAVLAEHGFSALVTINAGGGARRVLFDAGLTPDGVADNMRRLGISAKDVEVVVLSHGHFDHTTGLDGFVRAVGRTSLPVIIHPAFWTQRRIAIPGREPFELPSTSRAALQGAGFDIVEDRRGPSCSTARCS